MLISIFHFFESIGRARAAAHLANHGHYELAKRIFTENSNEFEVHP